jgi:hypothetical protein
MQSTEAGKTREALPTDLPLLLECQFSANSFLSFKKDKSFK